MRLATELPLVIGLCEAEGIPLELISAVAAWNDGGASNPRLIRVIALSTGTEIIRSLCPIRQMTFWIANSNSC